MKRIFIIGISKSKFVFSMQVLSLISTKNVIASVKCHYCNGILEMKETGIDHLLFACEECKTKRN